MLRKQYTEMGDRLEAEQSLVLQLRCVCLCVCGGGGDRLGSCRGVAPARPTLMRATAPSPNPSQPTHPPIHAWRPLLHSRPLHPPTHPPTHACRRDGTELKRSMSELDTRNRTLAANLQQAEAAFRAKLDKLLLVKPGAALGQVLAGD